MHLRAENQEGWQGIPAYGEEPVTNRQGAGRSRSCVCGLVHDEGKSLSVGCGVDGEDMNTAGRKESLDVFERGNMVAGMAWDLGLWSLNWAGAGMLAWNGKMRFRVYDMGRCCEEY